MFLKQLDTDKKEPQDFIRKVWFNTPPQILRANLFAANLRPMRRGDSLQF
jgi:hypothetical protein